MTFLIPVLVFVCYKSCNLFLFLHKNTAFWTFIILSLLIKTVFIILEVQDKFHNIVLFIMIICIDIYCLNLTITKSHRIYLEYSQKKENTFDEATSQYFQSVATSQVSRGGSMSSAYRNKQQQKIEKLGNFKEQNKKTHVTLMKIMLVLFGFVNLLSTMLILFNEIYPLSFYQILPKVK